jgi:hypothetical protein
MVSIINAILVMFFAVLLFTCFMEFFIWLFIAALLCSAIAYIAKGIKYVFHKIFK